MSLAPLRSGKGKFLFPTLLALFVAAGFITGCVPKKEMYYFKPAVDSNMLRLSSYNQAYNEPLIMAGEILEIKFVGKSEVVTAMLNNFTVASSVGGAGVSSSPGIQVDQMGYLTFPLIGKVKAAGLTKAELKDRLIVEAGKFVQEPIVMVNTTSERVTIMGEIGTPSSLILPRQKMNIYEVLALAGDATQWGQKSNIKIYREENGQRSIGTVNLTDTAAFNSPYFFVQKNDLIYVPPVIEKRKSANISQLLPYVSFGLSIISTLLSILIFLK